MVETKTNVKDLPPGYYYRNKYGEHQIFRKTEGGNIRPVAVFELEDDARDCADFLNGNLSIQGEDVALRSTGEEAA